MEKQLADLIKENKGILRQLTDLNNRVKKLEQQNSYYPNKEEIRNIEIGGTD